MQRRLEIASAAMEAAKFSMDTKEGMMRFLETGTKCIGLLVSLGKNAVEACSFAYARSVYPNCFYSLMGRQRLFPGSWMGSSRLGSFSFSLKYDRANNSSEYHADTRRLQIIAGNCTRLQQGLRYRHQRCKSCLYHRQRSQSAR